MNCPTPQMTDLFSIPHTDPSSAVGERESFIGALGSREVANTTASMASASLSDLHTASRSSHGASSKYVTGLQQQAGESCGQRSFSEISNTHRAPEKQKKQDTSDEAVDGGATANELEGSTEEDGGVWLLDSDLDEEGGVRLPSEHDLGEDKPSRKVSVEITRPKLRASQLRLMGVLTPSRGRDNRNEVTETQPPRVALSNPRSPPNMPRRHHSPCHYWNCSPSILLLICRTISLDSLLYRGAAFIISFLFNASITTNSSYRPFVVIHHASSPNVQCDSSSRGAQILGFDHYK